MRRATDESVSPGEGSGSFELLIATVIKALEGAGLGQEYVSLVSRR